MAEPVDHAVMRALAAVARGSDPGALAEDTTLDDAGLRGVGRLLFVSGLEAELGIELPADLIEVLETVGDVLHFVRVKVDQRAADPAGEHGRSEP